MNIFFLFNIFVITSVILFCILGTWQIYRLDWKKNLIDEIEKGLKSNPISYSKKITKNYQRVNVEGKYILDKQIFLYSLNEQGKPGYDVITPFEDSSLNYLLINRGWIESEFKSKNIINQNLKKNITGILVKNPKKNIFKPENDLEKNIWFSINFNEIEKINKKKFGKFILYLENNDVKIPLPKKITVNLPNNHLKYAITWYSIAISIFGYFLYFRKKNEIL